AAAAIVPSIAATASARSRGGKAHHRRDVPRHDRNASLRTALNVALTGTATASSEAAGSPAANAIDGDASTQWCSTQWTGSLTVDLGRARSLSGVGTTLGASST